MQDALERVGHYPKTYPSLVPSPFSLFFLLCLTRPNDPHCYPHAVIIVTDYCRDGRKAHYLGHLDGTGTELLAIYY